MLTVVSECQRNRKGNVETIAIEDVRGRAAGALTQAMMEQDKDSIDFLNRVIQLANFSLLQGRKLERLKNPMRESIEDELSEMTSLAQEQRQLLETAKIEVEQLGRVIIANQIEKQSLINQSAAAVFMLKRYVTLDDPQLFIELDRISKEIEARG